MRHILQLTGIIALLLTLTTAISCGKNGGETTTFILIRHAEKANDGTDNPDLTAAGKARAKKLVTMLADRQIEGLYATNFKRTRKTIKPLSDKLNIKMVMYDHADAASVDQIIKDSKGKTVVISGHSNSTPQLANKLIGKEVYTDFDESDYSKMIEVVMKGNQVVEHKIVEY